MRIEESRVGAAVARHLRAAAFAAVLVAVSAAGPCFAATGADSGGFTPEQRRAFDALSAEVGGGIEALDLRLDEANGTPTVLTLRTPARAAGARRQVARSSALEQAARQFLAEHRKLFKLTDPGAELVLLRSEVDEMGLSHLRYEQRYLGIPIWSKQVLVHLDAQGQVYLVQGQYEPTPQGLDVVPKITADAAIQASRTNLGIGDGALGQAASAELVLFAGEDKRLRLAYLVSIAPRVDQSWTLFVDAASGAVFDRLTNIRDGQAVSATGADLSGTDRTFTAWQADEQFYLLDPTLPLADDPPLYDPLTLFDPTRLPLDPSALHGDLVIVDAGNKEAPPFEYITSSSALGPWDPAAVSAMVNLAKVSNYWSDPKTFGRSGVDGKGESILGVVHYGDKYNNAFWNGTWLVFGDGDGALFTNLAGCLDVTAHEFAHGVTEHTAALVYRDQSGALNESYSDFFAAMIDGNWTVGEGCTVATPGYLRDMADPHQGLDRQPARMEEYQWLSNDPLLGDSGGVHTNSGIPNRAGYLLAEGLTTEGLGTSVGRATAEQIVFHSLSYLTPGAGFLDARRAWSQAAASLPKDYGPSAPLVAATEASWEAVGVREKTSLGNAWQADGSGGSNFCFISAVAEEGPGALVPLALAAAGLAAALKTRKGRR